LRTVFRDGREPLPTTMVFTLPRMTGRRWLCNLGTFGYGKPV